MKQVVQNFRTGELKVEDFPPPALKPGGLLVRTAFSLISAGTERITVETAKDSLVGKAMSRPDLVTQVLAAFKREGLAATYQKVKARLEQVKPMGYSASGIVTAVAAGAAEFSVGDRVACAGAGYASHSEINFVPANLCAIVPEDVSLEAACYTTLGAIAMQGVRQAEARLGEAAVVIGLGLVGQIAVQLLKAAGCSVLGIDPDPRARDQAVISGADATAGSDEEARSACHQLTAARGADFIVITAGTKSSGPVTLAADLARDRGRVVVVGLVGMDIPRNSYYQKELELRLSRSYGPGRYDPQYEENGIDYPIGYVRWTEKRNMEAFLTLASEGKVRPEILTTHRFQIDRAADAYNLIIGKGGNHAASHAVADGFAGAASTAGTEAASGNTSQQQHARPQPSRAFPPGFRCGIVLEYPQGDPGPGKTIVRERSQPIRTGEVGIGFIGAGNFARSMLLPIVARSPHVRLTGIVTATGISAKTTAGQFRFAYAATDYQQLLDDPETTCVFITTRHDSHHALAIDCLNRGKSVFVEKPLATTWEGLRDVIGAARQSEGQLFVGFNRRFAPLSADVKKRFQPRQGPLSIIYRVNAGGLPAEHWSHDATQGGGRIIGEVCHFVDFVSHITDSIPVRVFASAVPQTRHADFLDDSAAISIGFADGSVSSIFYAAGGDPSVAKERVEIFGDRSVALINDFKSAEFARGRKTTKLGGGNQDKGHAAEIALFLDAVRGKIPAPFSLESLAATTAATFAINESIGSGREMDVDLTTLLG
jgi:predicted dehydrogenase/threonine dehydrogenase-like Zn-dependent dehydrogenase